MVYAWESPHGNVGDDLNRWLWPRLSPGTFAARDEPLFVGIGSVVDKRLLNRGPVHIFGAGARGPNLGFAVPPDWTVSFVRGPLTARALGLRDGSWITDPAILVTEAIYEQDPCTSKEVGCVGYVPHFRTEAVFVSALCDGLGLRHISPTLSVDAFLGELRRCRLVVTESLHGAILADAFRIPWVAVSSASRRIEGATHAFKWTDWLESMELSSLPIPLRYPPLRLRSQVVRSHLLVEASRSAAKTVVKLVDDQAAWSLSTDPVLDRKRDQMMSLVSELPTHA